MEGTGPSFLLPVPLQFLLDVAGVVQAGAVVERRLLQLVLQDGLAVGARAVVVAEGVGGVIAELAQRYVKDAVHSVGCAGCCRPCSFRTCRWRSH